MGGGGGGGWSKGILGFRFGPNLRFETEDLDQAEQFNQLIFSFDFPTYLDCYITRLTSLLNSSKSVFGYKEIGRWKAVLGIPPLSHNKVMFWLAVAGTYYKL